jgi:hypothetical protein
VRSWRVFHKFQRCFLQTFGLKGLPVAALGLNATLNFPMLKRLK